MVDLKWEEPPPDGRGRSGEESQAIADELRRRPGRWAVVKEYDSVPSAGAYAGQIRNGVTRAWQPEGAFEAVSRKGKVYARYIGE